MENYEKATLEGLRVAKFNSKKWDKNNCKKFANNFRSVFVHQAAKACKGELNYFSALGFFSGLRFSMRDGQLTCEMHSSKVEESISIKLVNIVNEQLNKDYENTAEIYIDFTPIYKIKFS